MFSLSQVYATCLATRWRNLYVINYCSCSLIYFKAEGSEQQYGKVHSSRTEKVQKLLFVLNRYNNIDTLTMRV